MNINFENAPFKLTREYIDVLGGVESAAFKQFEELFIKGFLAIQKHVDGMFAIVQVCTIMCIPCNSCNVKSLSHNYSCN